jgi:hypothetical protein
MSMDEITMRVETTAIAAINSPDAIKNNIFFPIVPASPLLITIH